MSQGNSYADNGWVETFKYLKANFLYSTNVCKIAVIESINENGQYLCKDLNTSATIIVTYKLTSVTELTVGTLVCIICTDDDYRSNLNNVKNGSDPIKTETKTLHSINYGIIIGVVE